MASGSSFSENAAAAVPGIPGLRAGKARLQSSFSARNLLSCAAGLLFFRDATAADIWGTGDPTMVLININPLGKAGICGGMVRDGDLEPGLLRSRLALPLN